MSYIPLSIADHILNLSNLILPYRSFENQQRGNGLQVSGEIDNLELADYGLFLHDGSYSFDGNTLGVGVAEYFVLQVKVEQEFKALYEEGTLLLNKLYTYRQISKTIPTTPSMELKEELYRETVSVLEPVVDFIKQLSSFRSRACAAINFHLHGLHQYYSGTKQLSTDYEFFPSPDLFATCTNLFGLLIDLDFVKNLKPSLSNDLSSYKRALQLYSRNVASLQDELKTLQALYFFLSTPDPFVTELKKVLDPTLTVLEKFFVDLLEHTLDRLDDQGLMAPEEKHTLLKVMCLVFYVLDTPSDTHDKESRKRLEKRFDKALKLIKQTPVVCGFGEAPLSLHYILHKSKLFGLDGMKKQEFEDPKGRFYDLPQLLDLLVVEDQSVGLTLVKIKNDMAALRPSSADSDRQIYEALAANFQFLLKVATVTREYFLYKLSRPANVPRDGETIPIPNSNLYELAVRDNFTSAELILLVRLCEILIQCSNRLCDLPIYLKEAIGRHVHAITLQYVSTTLADVTIAASKSRKPIAVILQRLRDLALDYTDGTEAAKHNHLTQSQLYLLRVILNFAYSKRAKGMVGGLLKAKSFKDSEVASTQLFLKQVSLFPKMLDLANKARQAADLSSLYSRELYLEVCQVVQLPVQASLPFLMLQAIYEAADVSLQCAVLVPFAIYNDAGNAALFSFRQQHIYEEVEAEACLVLDLFILEISERLYGYAKLEAAEAWLDPAILEEVNRLQASRAPIQVSSAVTAGGAAATSLADIRSNRRGSLFIKGHSSRQPLYCKNTDWLKFTVRLKSLQLLGRSVNLNELIANSLNKLLQTNLSLIFAKNDSVPLSQILEIETMLKVTQTTHSYLSQNFSLTNWQQLILFQDETIGLTCFNGRMVTKVLVELLEDVIPNWCFNEGEKKFTKSPVELHEPPKRAKVPKMAAIMAFGSKELAFAYSMKHTSSSINSGHFNAIARLNGEHGISVIFGELNRHLEHAMRQSFDDLVTFFASNCPRSLLLPTLPSGFLGAYEYLKQHLKPLMDSPQFGSYFLQGFREIGNTLLVIKELQSALELQCLRSRIQMFPLLAPVDKHSQKSMLENVTRFVDDKLFPDPINLSASRWAHNISRMYAAPVPSMLQSAFVKLRFYLSQKLQTLYDYKAPHLQSLCPPNTTTDAKAFFRVWSGVLFSCCVLNAMPGYTSKEIYGDGFIYAGSVIIHLLDQTTFIKSLDYSQHVLSFASDLLRGSALGSFEINSLYDDASAAGTLATTQKKRVVSLLPGASDQGGLLQKRSAPSTVGHSTLHAMAASNTVKILKSEDSKRVELERFCESALSNTTKMNSYLDSLELGSPSIEDSFVAFMSCANTTCEDPYSFMHDKLRSQHDLKQTLTLVSGGVTAHNSARVRHLTPALEESSLTPSNEDATVAGQPLCPEIQEIAQNDLRTCFKDNQGINPSSGQISYLATNQQLQPPPPHPPI